MAVTELECPKCATVAINSDFCSCGEYLGWEVTTVDAVDGPAEYRAPVPPAPRVSTLLTLRDPAREADDAGADVSVSVLPGENVAVHATVRNQGEIVDTYDVRVEGLPDAWWTIATPTVFLNPWGSSGDYEQELLVRLHPPRTADSVAGVWPVTVVVRSRSLAEDVAAVPATLTVRPFTHTVMGVGPERRHGRRHGRFEVAVANHGNAPAEIFVIARDTEARCPVSVAPAHVTVPIGATATALVLVAAPRPLWFKQPIDHRVDVVHRVDGVESAAQRVAFRQKPWLPWWLPPAVALLAAFVAAILLLRRDPEVPKLKGDTVAEARVVLEKKGLVLGQTTYATAPAGVLVNTILDQAPAAGADIVEGEPVNITVATAAQTGTVPPVHGLSLAAAASKLKTARFAHDPQPSAAGDDWVVIRQDPAPGTAHEVGKPVTLAVENRASTAGAAALAAGVGGAAGAAGALTTGATSPATPSAGATANPSAGAPGADAAPSGSAAAAPTIPVDNAPADDASRAAGTPTPSPTARVSTATAKLPADLVFAGATSGQLYRLTGDDKQPARLTSAKHFLESPTRIDDGFAAVQVTDDARRLVTVSDDGKTVSPLADGTFHHPAYSPVRGLVAAISGDRLCVLDPQDPQAPTCAPAKAPVGRPAWAPDGRSVLVLNAGSDALLSYTTRGGDASRWKTPKAVYRATDIRSAVWLDDDRVAVLVAERRGGEAHLRLLTRGTNGRLKATKDFPALTGHELAAAGRHVALRGGDDATDDGPIVLLDTRRAQPRVRTLPSGVNPAWG